jgi:ribosomal protein S18 acetylase RimI-like enzyme
VAEVPAAPPLTFAALEPTPEEPSYQLQALLGEAVVGIVDISATELVAHNLEVDPAYRRRGAATALLDHARERFPALKTGVSTHDGDQFLAAYRARTGWPG